MEEDLARSGLSPEDLYTYVGGMVKIPKEALGGYVIPYFDPDGQPIVDTERYPLMYRVRLRPKPFTECQRYTQPSTEQLQAHGLTGSTPYFPPYKRDGDVICICEGEKKTVAVIKHLGLDAIGIGGCWTWGKTLDVHPWILDATKGKRIILIPDADVMRFDIARAYGNLAHALIQQGCNVEIIRLDEKIDDWLVMGGTLTQFFDLPRIAPTELNQTGDQLIELYDLAFSITSKGMRVPYQHSSNITKLIEKHPAFPKIWNNADTNRIMVGENIIIPDSTEMELANYLQHNLGFDKVHYRLVRDIIRAQSKKNETSPFLNWVKAHAWDGTPRLETWPQRLWGVEDSEYIREIATKWLVSACARMDCPGTKVDWMLITVGPQGTGKTSMPSVMFRENNLILYGSDNDKDLHMKIHSALCIGFDELDSFGKREASFLKAMITTPIDRYRPPYGSVIEEHGRRCVLYGSGNRHDFLVYDPSGYRRYAIMEVPRLLDFAALEIEVPMLWAEAWFLYQTDATEYWEVRNASMMAEEYVVPNVMEEQVIEFTEKVEQAGRDSFTMRDVLAYLGMADRYQDAYKTKEIAGILAKLGYQRIRSGGTRRWQKIR
jgi:hypothetical protein